MRLCRHIIVDNLTFISTSGLLEAVARHLYNCEVETKVLSTEEYHTENWKVQNHAVLQMHVVSRGVKVKASVLDDVTMDVLSRRKLFECKVQIIPTSIVRDICHKFHLKVQLFFRIL